MSIEQPAALWYKNEMALQDGDCLRIFVRLGGSGSYQPGFSLGIMKDAPRTPGLQDVVEGITFYMEEDNLWYLDNKDLQVLFDETREEIIFQIV
jgi:uncharacterized protein YneR